MRPTVLGFIGPHYPNANLCGHWQGLIVTSWGRIRSIAALLEVSTVNSMILGHFISELSDSACVNIIVSLSLMGLRENPLSSFPVR